MRFKWTTVAACALFSMLADAQVCEYLDNQNDPLPYLVESRNCFTEGCDAKEVRVAALSDVTVVGDGCESPTDFVTFEGSLDLDVNAAQGRYDIGLFIDFGTAETPCNAYTFPCKTDPDDGDTCGDFPAGITTIPGIQFTIPCDISGGQLVFPYCTSWKSNAGDDCTGPVDVNPDPTSKCKCPDEDEAVTVDICQIFVDGSFFSLQNPAVCPAAGEEVAVTIPAGAFVGTVDPDLADSDFLVTVTGTSIVDVPVTAETELNLSLPNGEYTLTVSNPSFQDPPCTATYTFTIDCEPPVITCPADFICDGAFIDKDDQANQVCDASGCDTDACCDERLCSDYTCSTGEDVSAAKQDTPCSTTMGDDNECSDTLCCETLCGTSVSCGDGFINKDDQANQVCATSTCKKGDCCDELPVCDDSVTCPDGEILIVDPADTQCTTRPCGAGECCEALPVCDDSVTCLDGEILIVDPADTQCTTRPCGAGECCEALPFCLAYDCPDGFVSKDDKAGIQCIDRPCAPADCCDEQTCDTSFGCEEVSGDSCSSPQLNDIDGVNSNRWGWYLEPAFDGTAQEFTFDMYAGAGQNVLANGVDAGNVIVTVNADGSSSYDVHPADGYCFDDIHVHVGNDLPTLTKKGVATTSVAPGQYTQADTLAHGAFYIIVHVGDTCTPCEPEP